MTAENPGDGAPLLYDVPRARDGVRLSRSNGRAYAGQSAYERDAQRRARLLEAARELIGTEGYAATTIERICSTASVSTRHFYLRYASKEAVFIDLYDTMTERSFKKVLTSWQETEGKPMRERAPAAFMAYLQPMLEDPHAARIAFVEVMGVSTAMERKRLDYRESLIAFIEREGGATVERGEATDRDFRFASLALIGAANVIVYDWAASANPAPVEELRRKLADLAITLLAD